MPPELVSLIAILVALAATVISYILMRLKRHPEVVVYAAPDREQPVVINLVVENKGKDTARDLTFNADKKIPARAFGFEDAPQPGYMADGPLVNGIPAFRPGERISITWGQYGGLRKGLGGDVLEVTANYCSKLPLGLGRRKHEKMSRVDLGSFEGAAQSKLRTRFREDLEESLTSPLSSSIIIEDLGE